MNTEEYDKTRVRLAIEFKDHKGKRYCASNFSYFYYVGEIERDT